MAAAPAHRNPRSGTAAARRGSPPVSVEPNSDRLRVTALHYGFASFASQEEPVRVRTHG